MEKSEIDRGSNINVHVLDRSFSNEGSEVESKSIIENTLDRLFSNESPEVDRESTSDHLLDNSFSNEESEVEGEGSDYVLEKSFSNISIDTAPTNYELAKEQKTFLENNMTTQITQNLVSSPEDASYPDENAADIKIIKDILPRVVESLKKFGQLDTYKKFNELVAKEKMPMRNIAYLLFQDVVDWHYLNDTRLMRYSPEVKLFWRIGLKLFKGKFLRFMSGMKNKGPDRTTSGNFDPAYSSINFVVPDHNCLDGTEVSKELGNIKPGIIHQMIKMMSDDESLPQSYKLCFDGKKVNSGIDSGIMGDVNLWEYEGPPSLSQRQNALEVDLKLIDDFHSNVLLCEARGLLSVSDASDALKQTLVCSGRKTIIALSFRMKDLKGIKRKKEIFLEKLKKICINEQLRKKYEFAISAVKTYVYRIDSCINRTLNVIDCLGQTIAILGNAGGLYCTSRVCDLNVQGNYHCLTGIHKENMSTAELKSIDPTKLRQLSDAWFTLRSFARVTGSTCFNALGLGGVKKQKQHFDYVYHSIPKPSPSEDVAQLFKYGSDNEINAIATLVSKFLPVFMPEDSFFEEGCHCEYTDDTLLLLVSPDGCIKETNTATQQHSSNIHVVEVKCPFPGNIYKPTVYYEISYYYVPQILFEMAVHDKSSLIFICYSSDTSVIMGAAFDE